MPILKSIRVLLVDDSLVVLAALKRLLANAPEIQVAGTARNGREAFDLIERLKPDILCTDLFMPEMNGLELVRAVMARAPMPILVISAAVEAGKDNANMFSLLEAGALDVFPKPQGDLTATSAVAQELCRKIRILAGVRVFAKRFSPASAPKPAPAKAARRPLGIVAIGASTGGPQALQTIFSTLPSDFPAPVLCVQHISAGFLTSLVDWLAGLGRMRAEIAQPGQRAVPGTIYFPVEGTHLEFDAGGAFVASSKAPFEGHRPSATVLFESVAKAYGRTAIGVLLTGMGTDGALGLAAIDRAGGITIAQDQASSVVFGMPRAAIELGAAQYVLPIGEIGSMLCGLVAGTNC
jgi:two-component system, chemotaxis family, protein-glutamate methylesterase/glutaminase